LTCSADLSVVRLNAKPALKPPGAEYARTYSSTSAGPMADLFHACVEKNQLR
jgi:hypothetical protein